MILWPSFFLKEKNPLLLNRLCIISSPRLPQKWAEVVSIIIMIVWISMEMARQWRPIDNWDCFLPLFPPPLFRVDALSNILNQELFSSPLLIRGRLSTLSRGVSQSTTMDQHEQRTENTMSRAHDSSLQKIGSHEEQHEIRTTNF